MKNSIPLLGFMLVIVIACFNLIKSNQSKKTELRIVNSSQDTITGFLTLSGYPPDLAKNYIQNVNGIFGCSEVGLNGTFTLAPGDSSSYISEKRFSANLSFGSPPINCPDSLWPTGVNPFEFNLNCPQESIDISAIGGVNCILAVDLIKGPNWVAASFDNVRHIENDSMYKNTNLVGVFPYGCTNCINTQGKQSCQTNPEQPDSARICNPTRAKNKIGGTVRLQFKGYTNKK